MPKGKREPDQEKKSQNVFFERNQNQEIPLDEVNFNPHFFMFIGDNQEIYGRSLGYDFLAEMRKFQMISATRDAPAHMGGNSGYVPLEEGIGWVKNGMVVYFTHWDNDQGRSLNFQGMDVEKYHDYLIDTAKEANRRLGCRRIWINYGGEADSCFPWPVGRIFETRKEAFAYYRNHVQSKEERPECFQFWGPWFRHALKKSTGNLRRLPIIWTCAEVHDVHYWFEWGIPFITFETNCWRNLPLNVEIAFTRGAARQYNSLWGIDISLWNWPGRITIYNKLNEWVAGNTAEYFLRQWILSYMSGANAVHFELAASQFFTEKGPETKMWPEKFGDEEAALLEIEEFGPQKQWFSGNGILVPSPIGNNAIDFSDFSLRRHIDRGEPVPALGIMLDYYHGWGSSASFSAPPDNRVMWQELYRPRVWGDCVTREPGDFSLDNFFRAAFPPVHKDITRDPVTSKLTAREMFESFWEGRLDPEDYLPGLADTRWGNNIEVILENAETKVLSEYPNLLLLGTVKPDKATWKRIFQYVQEGGNLIASIAHVDESMANQIGLKGLDVLKPGIPHNTVWRNEPGKCGVDRLIYHSLSGKNSEVITKTSTDDSLLLKFSIGKGFIYISAVPHYLDLDGNIAPHFLVFLDELMKAILPAFVSGPGIDFTVSVQGEKTIITLLNHHREPWKGYIVIPRTDDTHPHNLPTVRDIWRERILDSAKVACFERSWRVEAGVRPRSLALIEILN